MFPDHKAVMKQLKIVFKTMERVFFHGGYDTPFDPSISENNYVKQTAIDIWKASGYRFRYFNNKSKKKKKKNPVREQGERQYHIGRRLQNQILVLPRRVPETAKPPKSESGRETP